MAQNAVSRLGELVQKRYGKNIITRVISIEGEDHCPEVTVEVEIPNQDQSCYQGKGSNKRNAAVQAAEYALIDLFQ